jgi:TLC domain
MYAHIMHPYATPHTLPGAGFLLWELSTPFMHLRWVLYKLGKENSSIYTLNALAGGARWFLQGNTPRAM